MFEPLYVWGLLEQKAFTNSEGKQWGLGGWQMQSVLTLVHIV